MKVAYNKNPNAAKITLVNYSNKDYLTSQKKNVQTGFLTGDFEKAISYSEKDIDSTFYNRNKDILKEKKGNGYWIWKPYFIKKTLEQLQNGELMFYCDSGSHFIGSVKEIISKLDHQDIVPFELQQNDSFWTKKDTFVLMDCDKPDFFATKQRLASFILLRKSDFAMQFIEEWINYTSDARIVTDMQNQCGFDNFPEFIDHRHDQSVFSLLSKKYNLRAFRDPSQYGNNFKELYLDSTYPQILVSTRQKDLSFIKSIKKKSKKYMPESFLVFYRKVKSKL